MRIPLNEVRPGDLLVFRGSGFVFNILGGILKLFEPQYDRWGWHVAFVSNWDEEKGWLICESISQGIVLSQLSEHPPDEVRAYRWFETAPLQSMIDRYLVSHLGKQYDVAIYFWTTLQYLIRHYWNRRIPRLLDDRYTCWENLTEFCEDMGKPIQTRYDCPILTDILRALGKDSFRIGSSGIIFGGFAW